MNDKPTSSLSNALRVVTSTTLTLGILLGATSAGGNPTRSTETLKSTGIHYGYTVNVALGKHTASHNNELPGYGGTNTVDNKHGTYWSSGQGGDQFLLIDLGDLYDIREIRLLTAQDQIQNTFHRIRYAKDASAPYRQWWDFKGTTHDNQWLAREENSGNTIQARYIKVETKDSASRAGWRQIELYGHRVTPPPRVIVFGWDGVQKNHFKDLYDKALLPTSRSLAEKGNLVEIYVTGNTHTKPGWATTLTGYDAPITGVYTNWLFQSIPADLTIFEKLHEHYGPGQPIESDGVYTLMVTGKNQHLGDFTGRIYPLSRWRERVGVRVEKQAIG